jgi:hypothetical protein
MPRLQLRLATLALLIVIVALATALFVQWRRERVLKAQVQVLEAEIAGNRGPIGRMILARAEYARQKEVKEANKLRAEIDRLSDDRMRLERLRVTQQREVNRLRVEIDRLSDEGKDAGRNRSTARGEVMAPKD